MFENIRIVYTQYYEDVEFYKSLEDLKKKENPTDFSIIYEDMSTRHFGVEELIKLGVISRESISEEEILGRAQEMVAKAQRAINAIAFRENPNKPLMITGSWPGPTNIQQAIIDIKRNLKLSWA